MGFLHYMTVSPCCGGAGGIEIDDAERSRRGSGALGAAGDGALEGAVAEIDVDYADGPN